MLIEEAVRIVQARWRKPLRPLLERACDECGKHLSMLESACTVYDFREGGTHEWGRWAVPGAYHLACCAAPRERFAYEVESLRWCPSWGNLPRFDSLRSPSQPTPKPPLLARDAPHVSTPKDSG